MRDNTWEVEQTKMDGNKEMCNMMYLRQTWEDRWTQSLETNPTEAWKVSHRLSFSVMLKLKTKHMRYRLKTDAAIKHKWFVNELRATEKSIQSISRVSECYREGSEEFQLNWAFFCPRGFDQCLWATTCFPETDQSCSHPSEICVQCLLT